MTKTQEVVPFDDYVYKRNFIEAYAVRSKSESPTVLLKKLDIPKELMAQWMQDPDFLKALQKEDEQRAWRAKEILYRNLDRVMNNLVQLACDTKRNSPRAVELIMRATRVVKDGSQGSTTNIENLQITNKISSKTVQELEEERDELRRKLGRATEAAIADRDGADEA